MDLTKLLKQLHMELAHLDAAILSLERLQTEGKRRGRPSKAASEMREGQAAPKATRRRQARRTDPTK
jgi:hypothetical protein